MTTAAAIGTRIFELRRTRGLTQVELAQLTGMRQPAIVRIEAGLHVPTWRTLERLAKALGAEVEVSLVEQ